MYIPKKFEQKDHKQLLDVIRQYPFATLITQPKDLESGIDAMHLPVVIRQDEDSLRLQGHIAKANPLWKTADTEKEAMLLFHGPHHYISPNHYPTKKEHGRAVPTWNYVTVHVKGRLRFERDAKWLHQLIHDLTEEQEQHEPNPWTVADAPQAYIDKMLPAIVGVELVVESLQGQWKLSQNQPEPNQTGVINALEALEHSTAHDVAAMMKQAQKGQE